MEKEEINKLKNTKSTLTLMMKTQNTRLDDMTTLSPLYYLKQQPQILSYQ